LPQTKNKPKHLRITKDDPQHSKLFIKKAREIEAEVSRRGRSDGTIS
jgi:hypothetical protein